MSVTKTQKRIARARKTHAKAKVSGRPRLIVFRSNTAVYAHIFDDATGTVVVSANSLKKSESGVAAATAVGKELAEKAKVKKLEAVSFDRNGYRYHGRVKAVAEGAREGGLNL